MTASSLSRKLCVSGKVHASCGLGLNTQTINTTFALNGSMSARAKIVTTCYPMTASDFAVLANATKAISVTLPAASTGGSFGTCIGGGMIVFIKNTTANAVTVKVHSSSDTIEGSASISLSSQYDSLQLISNGTNEWFLVGNSVGDAFKS
jgi:hypothetical protein